MTNSVVLNFFVKIYNGINNCFENSFVYRFFVWLFKKTESSVFCQFVKSFFTAKRIDYGRGSLYIRLVRFVILGVTHIFKKLLSFLNPSLQNSVVHKLVVAIPIRFLLMVFLCLMPVVPHGSWNNMYIFLAMVGFMVLYLYRSFSGVERGIDIKAISPSLFVYGAFLGLSLITGFGGSDSLRMLVILLSCIMFAILIENITTDKKVLYGIVGFLLVGATLTALYGLLQYARGIEVRSEFVDLTASEGLRRLFSTMDNPNNYAEFLIMVIPMGVAAVCNIRHDFWKLVVCGMTLLCVLVLVLTGSRSSYLAIMAAAFVYLLLTNPRLLPYCMILFVLAIPFLPSSIIQRLQTIGMDSSSKYRMDIWTTTFYTIKDFFITGVGIGPIAFNKIYRVYAGGLATNAMHAHNLFLQVWVEIGIGGFLAFVAFIISVYKKITVALYSTKNKEYRNWLAAFAASFTAILLMGLVEYCWFYPRVLLMFWVVIGLALGTSRLFSRENAK